jgi:hypothetical protein
MKYKVKDGKQIRLREADKVTALAVGTLASGEVFDAEIVRDDATGLWVKVADKRFGAVRDAKGEVFADVVDTTPIPTFPTSFTLDDGKGGKALYQFVRMVE